MSEEEIIKFLSCDDCKFATCEQCEINYTTKKAIKDLIEKQDKMIDLIIDEQLHIPENEIYKVEKIYQEVKDKIELKGRELKRYCIKEYFRKKVENEN